MYVMNVPEKVYPLSSSLWAELAKFLPTATEIPRLVKGLWISWSKTLFCLVTRGLRGRVNVSRALERVD